MLPMLVGLSSNTVRHDVDKPIRPQKCTLSRCFTLSGEMVMSTGPADHTGRGCAGEGVDLIRDAEGFILQALMGVSATSCALVHTRHDWHRG